MTERINDLNSAFRKSAKQVAADLLRQDWFNEYTISFAQPINATTEEAVRRLIEQGVVEGWSVPTMQKHLGALFSQWMTGKLTAEEFEWFKDRMPEWRREAIVRSETMRALNAVSYQLYGTFGATEHEWLSAHDNRTRLDHREADGQVVKIGALFNVGGEGLLYPLDPRGSAGNTVNCRCCTTPIIRS